MAMWGKKQGRAMDEETENRKAADVGVKDGHGVDNSADREQSGQPQAEGSPDAQKPAEPQPAADELAELKDQLLRLRADFDNFRKRTLRDRDEYNKRATERLLSDLLPIIDHFEMGLQQAKKLHVKHAVIDGFAAVFDQMRTMLAKVGVEEIEAEGKSFDPKTHECIAHAHSDKHAENTVISQVRRGYKLGHYMLRAAQVVVSSGSQKSHGDAHAGS
jgi:molecular chaperone GrpE